MFLAKPIRIKCAPVRLSSNTAWYKAHSTECSSQKKVHIQDKDTNNIISFVYSSEHTHTPHPNVQYRLQIRFRKVWRIVLKLRQRSYMSDRLLDVIYGLRRPGDERKPLRFWSSVWLQDDYWHKRACISWCNSLESALWKSQDYMHVICTRSHLVT
jgi:hypothetical protein